MKYVLLALIYLVSLSAFASEKPIVSSTHYASDVSPPNDDDSSDYNPAGEAMNDEPNLDRVGNSYDQSAS